MSTKTYTGNEGVREQPSNLLWIGLIVSTTLLQTQVTVGASALALPTTALSKRRTVMIFNNSGNILYLGNSSVTTADGLPVYPHSSLTLNIEDSVVIYGVASAAGTDVRILEGS